MNTKQISLPANHYWEEIKTPAHASKPDMSVKVRFYDEDKFFYRELAMKPEDFFEFRTRYQFRAINREATGIPAPRLGEKILYSSGSEHFGEDSEEIESDDEADPEDGYEDLEGYQ